MAKTLTWKFELGRSNYELDRNMNTFGNEIRLARGEQMSLKTHHADLGRENKIAKHNSTAIRRGKHFAEVVLPNDDLSLPATTVWPRLGRVRCTECGADATLLKLTAFMGDTCKKV